MNKYKQKIYELTDELNHEIRNQGYEGVEFRFEEKTIMGSYMTEVSLFRVTGDGVATGKAGYEIFSCGFDLGRDVDKPALYLSSPRALRIIAEIHEELGKVEIAHYLAEARAAGRGGEVDGR